MEALLSAVAADAADLAEMREAGIEVLHNDRIERGWDVLTVMGAILLVTSDPRAAKRFGFEQDDHLGIEDEEEAV